MCRIEQCFGSMTILAETGSLHREMKQEVGGVLATRTSSQKQGSDSDPPWDLSSQQPSNLDPTFIAVVLLQACFCAALYNPIWIFDIRCNNKSASSGKDKAGFVTKFPRNPLCPQLLIK